MADGSAIEWTSATWNPVAGCSILSPGCSHCYAMGMAARIEKMMAALGKPTPYAGLTQPNKAGPVWNGRMAVASDETLTQPLRWKRPRRIFVNSMSDLFHEGVADETIDRIFAVMALSPQHTFQVLTKRAQRMREYLTRIDREPVHETARRLAAAWPGNQPIPHEIVFPLPNVWLGVSTEDQARADERIPHLLATPAAKRFISAEPLLGAININDAMWAGEDDPTESLNAEINWVIAGGESGPRARPMHPDWARGLRDQCAAAGVPFFFKQWGEWLVAQRVGPPDDFRFGDGTAFPIVSDGHDIIAAEAEDYRGQPKKIWREFWATGEGHLAKRPGKKAAGAELDGKLHREFPT
jgi:protein gp37